MARKKLKLRTKPKEKLLRPTKQTVIDLDPKSESLVAGIRAAASSLQSRALFAANVAGITFHGQRDLYRSLGYQRIIYPLDYRSRFRRNAVAARIVEALPKATWRGGGQVIEDETSQITTDFEKAFDALNTKLNLWSMFLRADILAGLGRYSTLLLGTPGLLEKPLTRLRPGELVYLTPFSEEDAQIASFDNNIYSRRFGLPVLYSVRRVPQESIRANSPEVIGRPVHFTRIIHIADTLLDDHVYGIPRLERVWNLLDDLEKVTGGGAEAFWKRADQGLQLDLNPELDFTPQDEKDLDKQVERYTHGLERVLKTRGVTANPLGSDVAGFKDPVESIMSQISAGTGIPQRILMGSERGNLASTTDAANWNERVSDRRVEFAAPQIVRPFIDRLIELGALPRPNQYNVRWPEMENLDEIQKAKVAETWAGLNQKAGERVVSGVEIRDHCLGLDPLTDVQAGTQPTTANKKLIQLVRMLPRNLSRR